MNRVPLRRRAPMPRAGQPLARRGGLQRTAALRPASAKRRAENRERRAMAARQFGPEVPLCGWPEGPAHWADAYHEILTRARGGSPVDEGNTLPMCNLHNGMLPGLTGARLAWAYQAGLLKRSGRPSKAVPRRAA